jgi:hypothetical protein
MINELSFSTKWRGVMEPSNTPVVKSAVSGYNKGLYLGNLVDRPSRRYPSTPGL